MDASADVYTLSYLCSDRLSYISTQFRHDLMQNLHDREAVRE